MILPDEKAGIHFQVEAKPSQDDTAFITLKVFESESDDPIPDARITLSTVDDELVTESLTEADGNVDFQHIPIGRYRFRSNVMKSSGSFRLQLLASNRDAT
ncbi:carboxypeptidase-like regulatory domain-containing protein [Chloroflexi bacterium TSY]|nr:carboxypeptidase-like regulatory domain-containing protein [Chloroflexi bacterium TSY]